MNRFFQEPENGMARLSKEDAHHLVRVLRKKIGDAVEIAWEGHAWKGTIESIEPCMVRLGMSLPSAEPPYALHLIQALAKGDKMDWIVQKAVELGVAGITPVHTRHGDVKLEGSRAKKRRDHWQKIAVAAAKQSKRSVIPVIEEICTLNEAIGRKYEGPLLVFHEKADGAAYPAPGPATLCIGPEGGFSDEELDRFLAAGARILSLGPRILRTETAGLAALSILQYNNGDINVHV